jgi:protoporphyrinogen oxidase
MTTQKIVIGAGLAGLTAAFELEQQEHSVLILEKDAEIGGKLKTEVFEGKYLLDHGFQVLLPGYSSLQTLLPKLSNLKLCEFSAGARLKTPQGLFLSADPLRHPSQIFASTFGGYASFSDKLKVLRLRAYVLGKSEEQLLAHKDQTTLQFLKEYGFSQAMIDHFWTPFYGGIFLEKNLETSVGYFLFLFKVFSLKKVAVPEKGIAEFPKALRARLKRTEILFHKEVLRIEGSDVHCKDQVFSSQGVIDCRPKPSSRWGVVTTLYFAAPKTPLKGAWLYLKSAQLPGLINHIAVMSEVSASYAPAGESLVSVNVIQGSLSTKEQESVRKELFELFGEQVQHWRFLKMFEIPQALPLWLSGQTENFAMSQTPSQQGAILRGKLAAN